MPTGAAGPREWASTAQHAITNRSKAEGERSYVELHTRLIPAADKEPELLDDYVVIEAMLTYSMGRHHGELAEP